MEITQTTRTLRLRSPSGRQHTSEAMYASAYSLCILPIPIPHNLCVNLRRLREKKLMRPLRPLRETDHPARQLFSVLCSPFTSIRAETRDTWRYFSHADYAENAETMRNILTSRIELRRLRAHFVCAHHPDGNIRAKQCMPLRIPLHNSNSYPS